MIYKKIFYYIIIVVSIIFYFYNYFKIDEKSIQGYTMGTFYTIKYINKSSDFLSKISSKVLHYNINQYLEKINNEMSTYRSNSELSKFNKFKYINIPFNVSSDIISVIKKSIYINKLTNGALDITIGPLVNLWGFGPKKKFKKIPSEKIIKLYLQYIGMNKLVINKNNLIKKDLKLYVDLSSIAKGYGVDIIAKYLESQNIHNYMVNIGGEIRTNGYNKNGISWRIAIEKPLIKWPKKTVQKIIKLGNMSIATSGSYRNYFKQNKKYYSHIIDPKTGKPIIHNLISITVIAKTCMMADGLSTALNVLGVNKSMELAENLNLPVFMIINTNKGFKEYYSTSFKSYLIK